MPAKKEIREIEVVKEIASLVDSGTGLDNEIKNLQFRSKANKASMVEAVSKEFQDGEKSIRILGNDSKALISKKEKVTFEEKTSTYNELLNAVEAGEAPEGVVLAKQYTIKNKIKEVMEVLAKEGLLDAVEVKTTISMDAEKFKSTHRRSNVQKALKECGRVTPSFTIKYEVKE